jgi:hypothetical protein
MQVLAYLGYYLALWLGIQRSSLATLGATTPA